MFGNPHLLKEISSISKGGEKLHIIHRTKNLAPIVFKPDRVFTLRDRTKVTFQILESQTDKRREIEADILRAYLCTGVSKLVFIVPTASDYAKVNGICDIIRDVMEALGAREDLDINLTILIPKSARSPNAVAAYLNDPQITREIFRKERNRKHN